MIDLKRFNKQKIYILFSTNLFDLIGWIGAFFMVVFSFTLITPLAILGLSLLTIQAYKVNLTNLVILNLISIIGFSLNYFI